MAETRSDDCHRRHDPSVNQGSRTDKSKSGENVPLEDQKILVTQGGKTEDTLCSWGEKISEWIGTLAGITTDYILHCDWKHAHEKLINPVVWMLWILSSLVNFVCSLVPLVWVILAPLILRHCDLLTGTASLNKKYYNGKVFWITGGASGIGFSLARHISVLGVKGIILLDRSLDLLETARREIVAFAKAKGVDFSEDDILLIPLDLSRGLRPDHGDEEKSHDSKWKEAVDRAVSWRGGVDTLINNAGRLSVGCFSTTEVVNELMDINFTAAVKLTNLLLPHMCTRRTAHIIFMNSAVPYWSFGGSNAYTTSKAALYSFTNLLRQDLRGNGLRTVKVTSIHPGVVKTPLYTNFLDSRVDEKSRPQPIPIMKEEMSVPSLDVEDAVTLMIRAISQEQEEVWVAPTSQLMWIYFQYYSPQLRRFSHNIFARSECENLTRVKHDLVRDLKKRSGAPQVLKGSSVGGS